jgi:hypothetical protein
MTSTAHRSHVGVRRELVIVLVKGAERVEADHAVSLPRRQTLHYGNLKGDKSGAMESISP